MRRTLYSTLIILSFHILLITSISCSNTDKKTDRSADSIIKKENSKDSPPRINNSSRVTDDRIPSNDGQGTTTNTITNKPGKDDILANIDLYLVSKANIPNQGATSGISNASVSVKNTLPDITIQKAIVEVSILTNEGAEFRTDYYVIQNIEPGEVETIKIPNATRGTSIVSHIVKLKSQELTNGEMITVGRRVTPK